MGLFDFLFPSKKTDMLLLKNVYRMTDNTRAMKKGNEIVRDKGKGEKLPDMNRRMYSIDKGEFGLIFDVIEEKGKERTLTSEEVKEIISNLSSAMIEKSEEIAEGMNKKKEV